MEPLAITGWGVVGPLGVGRRAWSEGLAAYAQGTTFFAKGREVILEERFPSAWVAEAWNFSPPQYLGEKGLRNLDRLTKQLIVAAKTALEDAGVKKSGAFNDGLGPEDIGLCSSTAYGSLEAITELKMIAELEDPRYMNPARFPNTVINAAAGYVSIWEDLQAPNVTIVDGNCGALDAALTSSTHLACGRAKAFLIGGGEALSEALYLAFYKLGIVAGQDMRFAPGDAASQGTRLGEGAAYLCVEAPETARERHQKPLAYVLGYGTAFLPPESEALLVHSSPEAVRRAISHALEDASLNAKDIDLVLGSLCGIALFDHAELEGIAQALGKDIAVFAPKMIYGETFGASGALASSCALAWLHGTPIPEPILGSKPPRLETALVLTVGYYGNVSALIIGKAKP